MPDFTITAFTTTAQVLNFKEEGQVLVGGSLVSAANAVALNGNNAVFTNLGTTLSTASVAIGGVASVCTVINDGFISSKFSAISMQATDIGSCNITNTGVIAGVGGFANAISVRSGGLILNNTGTISATGDPVILIEAGVAAESNVIINTGLITNAAGPSIMAEGDADSVTNLGRIVGSIILGDGQNRLRNAGSIEGDVTTGAGADVIDLRGGVVSGLVNTGAGADRATGGAADDRLFGSAGADTLSGGAGDDVLTGGTQIDRMAGGAGADAFDFNTVSTSITGARDVITDFLRGADNIDLVTMDAQAGVVGNQAFTFIGTAAFSAEGQVRIIDQGANVVVQANRSGSLAADFEVMVLAVGTLGVGDFLL